MLSNISNKDKKKFDISLINFCWPFSVPHPHRHYTLMEFIDKLEEDSNFKNVILNK